MMLPFLKFSINFKQFDNGHGMGMAVPKARRMLIQDQNSQGGGVHTESSRSLFNCVTSGAPVSSRPSFAHHRTQSHSQSSSLGSFAGRGKSSRSNFSSLFETSQSQTCYSKLGDAARNIGAEHLTLSASLAAARSKTLSH